MKILLTTDTVGGVWTYSLTLARALTKLDCVVLLATMGGPASSAQRAEAEAVAGLELFESSFRLEWMSDPWDDVRSAGEWLLDLEQRLRPDVVHLNGYAHGALPWRAPVVMVAHSCVLSWWRAVRRESAPPEWDRYAREVARGLSAADAVVAPTRAMLDTLQRHYGPLQSAEVIPNGREAALFRPAPKEPLIMAAGRLWDEAKNIGALAAVAPRLEWPVVVAGETRPPEGASARLPLRSLGLLSSGEVAEWLGRAAIYALPARYEPFGLSVLEAALSGCALVLGSIPTLHEVWGDAALFVPPDDRDALQRALVRLIEDAALRDDLARAAGARAAEYTAERMGSRYRSLYRRLGACRGAATAEAREEEPSCVS